MAALLGEDGADARIVLASSVAESSLTIKRVTHVIDSCRACEVHWAPASGEGSPHFVWTSKAQAMQRAGRTGRTNHGTVWQLVTPSTYQAFPAFELASMQLQLLRKEVLLLTCATAKQLTDGRKVLGGCLDAPHEEIVRIAEQWLIDESLVEQAVLVTRQRSAPRHPTLRPTALGQVRVRVQVRVEVGVEVRVQGLWAGRRCGQVGATVCARQGTLALGANDSAPFLLTTPCLLTTPRLLTAPSPSDCPLAF